MSNPTEIKVTVSKCEAGSYEVFYNGVMVAELFSRKYLQDDGWYEMMEDAHGSHPWYMTGAECTGIESDGHDSKRELVQWLKDTALWYNLDRLAEVAA